MASTLPEVIDESLLTCLLCKKTQCEPKILRCLHTFCKKCLVGYIQKTAIENARNEAEGRGSDPGSHDIDSQSGEVEPVGQSDAENASKSSLAIESVSQSDALKTVSQSDHSCTGAAAMVGKSDDLDTTIPPVMSPTPMSSLEDNISQRTRALSSSQEGFFITPDENNDLLPVQERTATLRKRSRSMEDVPNDTQISYCDRDSGCGSGEEPRTSVGDYLYPTATPSPHESQSADKWPEIRSSVNRVSRQADSLYQDMELLDLSDPFPPPVPPPTPPRNQLPIAKPQSVSQGTHIQTLSMDPGFKDQALEPTKTHPRVEDQDQKKKRKLSEKPTVPPKPKLPLRRWTVNTKRSKYKPIPPFLSPLRNHVLTPDVAGHPSRSTSVKSKSNMYSDEPMRVRSQISVESNKPSTPSISEHVYENNGTICCPVCHFRFKEEDLDVDALKSCHFISRLQDFVMAHSSNAVSKHCGNCETASAKFRCFDCEQNLCGGCRDAHKWLKVTRGHKVMSLRELHSGEYHQQLQRSQMVKCYLCHEEEAMLFCGTCDVLICNDCRLVAHPHHACGDISTVATRDKDLLQQLLGKMDTTSEEFEETKRKVLEYEHQSRGDRDNLIENIKAQKERLMVAIDECYTELIQQINDRYKDELKINKEMKDDTQSVLTSMDHTKNLTSQLLRHGEDADVVSMTTILKERLQYLQHQVPSQRSSTMEMDFYPALPDLLTTMPMFGKVVQRFVPVHIPPQPSHSKQKAILEEKLKRQQNQPKLLLSFKARTDHDRKGCKPTGIATLPKGNIAIVDDINKKVKIFGLEGKLKSEICPSGEHAFVDPWDITITTSNTLAITDKGARCVKEFSMSGEFVNEFGVHLRSPWGIACNSKGHLIVTDTEAKTVFVHNSSGHLLYSLTPNDTKSRPRLFKCPEYVAVNHNDDIIVSDFEKHCILVFDSLGRLLYKLGKKGKELSQFYVPCGIAVDIDQNILVADYNNQRVSMIDRNGQFKYSVLTLRDQIVMPQALDITSRGYVVVADGHLIKVFKVREELQPPTVEDSEVGDFEVTEDKVADSKVMGSEVNGSKITEIKDKEPKVIDLDEIGTQVDKFYNATYGAFEFETATPGNIPAKKETAV